VLSSFLDLASMCLYLNCRACSLRTRPYIGLKPAPRWSRALLVIQRYWFLAFGSIDVKPLPSEQTSID
jgi:hypothetical protein